MSTTKGLVQDPVRKSNITLLTLPAELRLKIFEHMSKSPLDLCPARSNRFLPERNLQQESAIALLSTCRQIRREATPILYEKVYLLFDSTLTILNKKLDSMDSFAKSSVKEAHTSYSCGTSEFRVWLHNQNIFPNLQRCKIFLKLTSPFSRPPHIEMLRALSAELLWFRQNFFVSQKPMPAMEIDLIIYMNTMKVEKTGLPGSVEYKIVPSDLYEVCFYRIPTRCPIF
jgi:hypothetical protein